MTRTVLVISAGHRGNGLTSVSLGLVRALQRQGRRVGFCKPIAQSRAGQEDGSIALARLTTGVQAPAPLSHAEVDALLATGDLQTLLEQVVARCQSACDQEPDVLVVEGLVPSDDAVYGAAVNAGMAQALDAQVLLVAAAADRAPVEVASACARALRTYDIPPADLLGVVLNKVPTARPPEALPSTGLVTVPPLAPADAAPWTQACAAESLPVVGLVPHAPALARPRTLDVARAIGATILSAGDLARRVEAVEIAAMTVPNVLARGLLPGMLLVSPGDRIDTLLGVALAELRGTRLAGLVLSGDLDPPPLVMDLIAPALQAGLPLLRSTQSTFATALAASALSPDLPADDRDRAEWVVETVASALDAARLAAHLQVDREPQLSPPAFRHLLIEQARAADKRIVLPEGTEPRTLAAAAICARRGIARCALIGRPQDIEAAARRHGVDLTGVEILDPRDHLERYVEPLCALRRHKGLHPEGARMLLRDDIYLGTMMLKQGDVDGLVSGAVNTTANTIRPALQVIKTAPGYGLVSSVFFMCLPQQVLVYGDCAVNPDPTADQLADIAIQSADSAKAFGIPPRVAMISYSTGVSGQGAQVEKVAAATALVRARRPDLLVDGPLQYDAASVESVGRSKAPDSPVAGRATVFVFPDLNTGNAVYKAVQRSANVVSMGPMLQGLDLPVNDLSRGALVEDIVFTIALTAIQAGQRAATPR